MSDAYIYDHVRTPRGKGKKDGSLHQASPVWLLSTLLRAMQQRNALDTRLVDDGESNPTARMAEISRVPLSTAQGWVARARAKGLLPPGRRGRAG